MLFKIVYENLVLKLWRRKHVLAIKKCYQWYFGGLTTGLNSTKVS